MVSVAEYNIPFQEYPFAQACIEVLDRGFEIECLKPTSEATRVYFWVDNGPSEPIEVADQSPFEALRHLETVADSSLFRVDWPDTQESVLKGLCRADAVVESVTRNSQQWSV